MHHAEYHGYQFNYNGDYSGDIHITDDHGFEWPHLSFDQLLVIVNDPEAQKMGHISPFRAFVADAIRMETISVWEQMGTDEILNSKIGRAILEDACEEVSPIDSTDPS